MNPGHNRLAVCRTCGVRANRCSLAVPMLHRVYLPILAANLYTPWKKIQPLLSFKNKHFSVETNGNVQRKEEDLSWNLLTIPNIMSISRILIAPLFGYEVYNHEYLTGFLIFSISALTDYVDGAIARKYKSQRSSIGSVLDPLADKILILTATGVFYTTGLIPAPVALLFIIKDVGLILGVIYYWRIPKLYKTPIKPLFLSKFNTALQLTLFSSTLLNEYLLLGVDTYILYAWYICSITTVLNAIKYFFNRRKILNLKNF